MSKSHNSHAALSPSGTKACSLTSSVTIFLSTLLFEMIVFHPVYGFTSIVYCPKRNCGFSSIFLTSPISPLLARSHHGTTLFATTYLPEDWVEDDSDSATSTLFGFSSSIIPPILQTPEWVAPLARLAAGHNLNGGLNIQHIEQVSVRSVAPSHVDIEAVVCEQDGCVSLLVPVPFSQPCVGSSPDDSNAAFEDCVMRNIQELDSVQLQKAASTPSTDASFTDSVAIEYPSWWIYPTATTSLEFAQECSILLGILNEPDFVPDVLTLVTKGLRRMLSIEEASSSVLQVQLARAVAVGPSGMIFRVQALYYGQVEVVDVPIPFATGGLVSVPDNDSKALREAVLDCVENPAP